MSYIEKEKLIKADIASIENRVRHAFNQGYDLGYKEGKERAKPLEPRWIPVSERLPEENMDVLVVVEFPDGKDGTLQRIEIASFGSMYHLSSEKGWITNNFTRIARTEVKAWMPLPAQYEP